MDNAPLILLAAGGTGGHLSPAEALGVELIRRGLRVRLATDSRALRYGGLFSSEMIDVVPSETVRGRSPWSLAYTGVMLAAGMAVSLNLMRRLKPAAAAAAGRAAVRRARHRARSQCGARPRQPFSVKSRQRDRDVAAGRARSRPRAVRQNHHRRHPAAPGDPRPRGGDICATHARRAVAVAGGWRQPGRARDGRYRSGRDRAAGAG